MSHCLDLRILEHGDVKLRRFLSLIIEPQKWSDLLHKDGFYKRKPRKRRDRFGEIKLCSLCRLLFKGTTTNRPCFATLGRDLPSLDYRAAGTNEHEFRALKSLRTNESRKQGNEEENL
jgi:hypothetical protein